MSDVNVHPHAFRHTIVGQLIEAGNSMELVSKFMGHSQVATTSQNYWVPTVTELHESLNNPFTGKVQQKAAEIEQTKQELDLVYEKLELALSLLRKQNSIFRTAASNGSSAVEALQHFEMNVPNAEEILRAIVESTSSSISGVQSVATSRPPQGDPSLPTIAEGSDHMSERALSEMLEEQSDYTSERAPSEMLEEESNHTSERALCEMLEEECESDDLSEPGASGKDSDEASLDAGPQDVIGCRYFDAQLDADVESRDVSKSGMHHGPEAGDIENKPSTLSPYHESQGSCRKETEWAHAGATVASGTPSKEPPHKRTRR